MLILDYLTVTTYDGSSLNISWDFRPDISLISDYKVNIYRAEAPISDINQYDLIASGISANQYMYIDSSVAQLLDIDRSWFYKLGIYEATNSGIISYQPEQAAYLKNELPDKIFRRIIKQKNLTLKFSGRNFKVVKKRTWGTHCPDCWDISLQRCTNPNCITCLGTGWINGYYDPISIKGMKNSSPKLNQINMFGEWKTSDSLLYILGFPPLKPKDIIIDDNNHLWTIVQVRTIERLGYIIEQIAQIASISQDELLYKYLIKWQ